MKCPTPYRADYRLVVLTFAVLFPSMILPSTPWSDPLPDAWYFVHVHQGTELITGCEQVQQYTEETGQLTFDIYLWPMAALSYYYEVGLEYVRLNAYWSPEWTVISAEPATGAVGTMDPISPYDYFIELSWPSCARQDVYEGLFWIARVVIDVSGDGVFQVYNSWYDICWPQPWPSHSAQEIWAHAGAGWSHCAQPCFEYDNYICMHPDQVWMSVHEGQTTQEEIEMHFGRLQVSPGWLIHESTASHITLEEIHVDPENVRLVMTADATDLEPGLYESYVRTTVPDQDCRHQAYVRLTVQPSTPAQRVSWGLLKGLYRP